MAVKAVRIEISTISIEVKQFLEEWHSAESILRRRYARCDRGGHQEDEVDGRCGYCYRLIDRTLNIERVMREREGMPLLLQPMDAPCIVRTYEKEKAALEYDDLNYGLGKIIEEMKKTMSVGR